MTTIRISNRLFEISKSAEFAPPPPIRTPPSAFRKFAYAVAERRVQVANLSSPWVGALHDMAFGFIYNQHM